MTLRYQSMVEIFIACQPFEQNANDRNEFVNLCPVSDKITVANYMLLQ